MAEVENHGKMRASESASDWLEAPFRRWDYTIPVSFSRGVTVGILWAIFGLVVVPSLLPTLYALVWSLLGTETVGRLRDVPTVTWYHEMLTNPAWLRSITYSAMLATMSSAFCCLILVLHFFSTRYYKTIPNRIAYAFVLLPVVFPAVIYALALRGFGTALGLPEKVTVFMGHMAFILPLQFFVLEPAQDRVPDHVLHSASLLGARPNQVLRSIFVPLVARGLLSSFWVGFFFSIDELVIASFVIDSTDLTVPRKLWDEMQRTMTPESAVVGTLLFLTYITVIVGSLLLQGQYTKTMMRGARD